MCVREIRNERVILEEREKEGWHTRTVTLRVELRALLGAFRWRARGADTQRKRSCCTVAKYEEERERERALDLTLPTPYVCMYVRVGDSSAVLFGVHSSLDGSFEANVSAVLV